MSRVMKGKRRQENKVCRFKGWAKVSSHGKPSLHLQPELGPGPWQHLLSRHAGMLEHTAPSWKSVKNLFHWVDILLCMYARFLFISRLNGGFPPMIGFAISNSFKNQDPCIVTEIRKIKIKKPFTRSLQRCTAALEIESSVWDIGS